MNVELTADFQSRLSISQVPKGEVVFHQRAHLKFLVKKNYSVLYNPERLINGLFLVMFTYVENIRKGIRRSVIMFVQVIFVNTQIGLTELTCNVGLYFLHISNKFWSYHTHSNV